MLRFKKMLCPTDFSDPSYEAFKTASELALQFSAELCLIHVIGPIPTAGAPGVAPPGFNVGVYQQGLEKSAQQDLQKVIDEKMPKELDVRAIVAHGDAANEIVRIADEEDADIIIIATHGRTGWRHLVFGSVAERVVRYATCPVLTVPAPKQEE
jgi:nucleotide-binding universal stress UspA family protein